MVETEALVFHYSSISAAVFCFTVRALISSVDGKFNSVFHLPPNVALGPLFIPTPLVVSCCCEFCEKDISCNA